MLVAAVTASKPLGSGKAEIVFVITVSAVLRIVLGNLGFGYLYLYSHV